MSYTLSSKNTSTPSLQSKGTGVSAGWDVSLWDVALWDETGGPASYSNMSKSTSSSTRVSKSTSTGARPTKSTSSWNNITKS